MATNRQPTRLRALAGGRSDDQDRSTAERADAAIPKTPPSWLDGEASREWRRIVNYAAAWPDWLVTADRALLAAYCTWWSTFVAAAKDVNDRGAMVPGRSSADQARGDDDEPALVQNRSVAIMREASTQLRLIAGALGLDVWHRQRITRSTSDRKGSIDDLLS